MLLLLCAAAIDAAPAQTVAEQYLLQAINQERGAAGLHPLSRSAALTVAARTHANRMSAAGAISHRFRGEADLVERTRTPGEHFSLVAENVAAGNNVLEMHTALMQSPRHRENILDPEIDTIGIAVIAARGTLWGVEDFAKTSVVLSPQQQEQQVVALLQRAGLRAVAATDEARGTCGEAGVYQGERSAVVIHLTTSDLSRLPPQLTARASQRDITGAAVSACPSRVDGEAELYRISVVLYGR